MQIVKYFTLKFIIQVLTCCWDLSHFIVYFSSLLFYYNTIIWIYCLHGVLLTMLSQDPSWNSPIRVVLFKENFKSNKTSIRIDILPSLSHATMQHNYLTWLCGPQKMVLCCCFQNTSVHVGHKGLRYSVSWSFNGKYFKINYNRNQVTFSRVFSWGFRLPKQLCKFKIPQRICD